MVIIKEWVRNIFMIVIAISFVEIILPSGNMKKYLQFIFSLIMLAVIIRPLSGLPSPESAVNVFSTDGFLQESREEESDFTQKYTKYTIDITGIYQEKIKEKIVDIMKTDFQESSVSSIELSMDERPAEQGGGYVNAIKISAAGSFDQDKARKKIAQEMGMTEDKIIITGEK